MDAVLLSWVATAYLLAAAMFLVPFGRLSDLMGRKRIFLWGMVVITVLSLALGLSLSGEMLVVLRFIQGIGAAMVFGTGLALLTAVYPKEERGKVLGINVAAVYVGLSVGPFVGVVKSYTTVDLSAEYYINNQWRIGLNVANLLDDNHYQAFGGDILERRALGHVVFSW